MEDYPGRINQDDQKLTPFFQIYGNILFFSNRINGKKWKVIIPQNLEVEIIKDYHIEYGHMGTKNIVNALERYIYTKGLYRKVKNNIKTCRIC